MTMHQAADSAFIQAPATETKPMTERLSLFGASATRKKREHDFALFKTVAAAFFAAPPSDPGHARMAARGGFHAVIGGVDPEAGSVRGLDPRRVEVFYGPRMVKSLGLFNRERLRFEREEVRESGAALIYAQSEDGAVTVTLHPCATDGVGAEEDAIVIGRYGDVAALTGRGTLERHWAHLRAYAEATSVDGEPDWRDSLRVWALRFANARVREGRLIGAELGRAAERAGSFGVGVAAAAAMLAAFGV